MSLDRETRCDVSSLVHLDDTVSGSLTGPTPAGEVGVGGGGGRQGHARAVVVTLRAIEPTRDARGVRWKGSRARARLTYAEVVGLQCERGGQAPGLIHRHLTGSGTGAGSGPPGEGRARGGVRAQ